MHNPQYSGASNDGAMFSEVPLEERKRKLCERLCEIHGKGRRSMERSGDHLYIPCPVCRQNHGHSREAKSKHLAINLDTYFSPSRLTRRSKSGKSPAGYAMCMKHDEVFSVEQLLGYEVQPDAGHKIDIGAPEERYLVSDGKGNRIPAGPGETVSLSSLPQDHPAILYLTDRGYDISLLCAQFDAAFCTKEAPEDDYKADSKDYKYGGRFYRRHPGGFKSTPQGRVIFFADVNGARNCWQGRYLELKDKDPATGEILRTWIWHPYEEQWVIKPDWDKKDELVKYNTAFGSSRNLSLGGYDHVISRAKHSGDDWCLITEGPLDAARAPHNGLCLFGRYVSDVQALLLRPYFRRVILGFDTDAPGRKSCEKAEEVLAHHGIETFRFFPGDTPTESKQDIGALGYEATARRIQELLSS